MDETSGLSKIACPDGTKGYGPIMSDLEYHDSASSIGEDITVTLGGKTFREGDAEKLDKLCSNPQAEADFHKMTFLKALPLLYEIPCAAIIDAYGRLKAAIGGLSFKNIADYAGRFAKAVNESANSVALYLKTFFSSKPAPEEKLFTSFTTEGALEEEFAKNFPTLAAHIPSSIKPAVQANDSEIKDAQDSYERLEQQRSSPISPIDVNGAVVSDRHGAEIKPQSAPGKKSTQQMISERLEKLRAGSK